jgi:hypothetical protein
MPTYLQTILLILHAATFTALFDLSPTSIHALASPLPFPLMAPDYSVRNNTATISSTSRHPKIRTKNTDTRKTADGPDTTESRNFARHLKPTNSVKHQLEYRAFQDRVDKLNEYYNSARVHSQNLSTHLFIVFAFKTNGSAKRGSRLSFIYCRGRRLRLSTTVCAESLRFSRRHPRHSNSFEATRR